MSQPLPRRNTHQESSLLPGRRRGRTTPVRALLICSAPLLLAGCTSEGDRVPSSPAATVTVTVTATPSPSDVGSGSAAPSPAVLQPQSNDRANLAYRSGMAAPETQFTVPSAGYEILYLCRNDGLVKGRVDQISAGLHATGAGDASDTALSCDDTVHTITVDAAAVRRAGRAGTIRKIALTGDKQDVLSIDLSVRALG